MSSLNNPLLIASAVNSKAGQDSIKQAQNALKWVLIIGGSVFAIKILVKQLKIARAKKYLNENGHKVEVQIALQAHKAMIGDTLDILGFNIELLNGTDEDILRQLSLQAIGKLKEISKAYKILFDRNFLFDIQSESTSEELRDIFKRLNSTGSDVTTPANQLIPFLKGEPLFIRSNDPITLKKGVKKSNGAWLITNDSRGTFSFSEEIGTVYDIVKSSNGEINYIVDVIFSVDTFLGFGVINHRDVTNKK